MSATHLSTALPKLSALFNKENKHKNIDNNVDIIIVGAGIIGCACAASLAKQGLRVVVIEASTLGGGATAAGMGHLVVMDDNPAELALTSYSLELWRQLIGKQNQHNSLHKTQHNNPHEYSACGTIWVATDEEEYLAAQDKHRLLQQHGISSQLLNAKQLQEAEPNLRYNLVGGLLVHNDALVYPPKSAALLMESAIHDGAQLIQGEVCEVLQGGVKLSNGVEIQGKEILIANGIAALKLLPELPLRHKKGHLLITDRYPQFIRHQLVELGYIKSAHASNGDSVAFNLQPRPTGQIFIGSSRQFDVTDKEIDTHILAKMLSRASSYVPHLQQLKALRAWTGFRAASPDGLPIIGPHPWRKNIWLATGHEGLGITTSLATAELIKDIILQQSSKISSAPYLPSRLAFTIPNLKE
jgi:glycine/D-amino acid oxidase-like deaminating enzyme